MNLYDVSKYGVPEPASLPLIGFGVLAVLGRRHRPLDATGIIDRRIAAYGLLHW